MLQTNRDREHVRHTVVFFIFLVSNIGGCLLPIGRPAAVPRLPQRRPVRLDALRWSRPWLFCVAVLLAVYYVWDTLAYRRETREHLADDVRHDSPLAAPRRDQPRSGSLGVVLAVALIVPGRPLPGTDIVVGDFVREGVLLGLTGLSLATTPRGLRKETEFSYAAIIEVACLFLGIFLTMQVPIEILQARGAALGLTTPVALLLGDRAALERPRQRADLPRLLRDRQDRCPPPAGPALVPLLDGAIRHDLLAAISLGRGLHGGEHLHRQRPEPDGQARSPSSAGSRCPASSATCSTAAACWSPSSCSSRCSSSVEGRPARPTAPFGSPRPGARIDD